MTLVWKLLKQHISPLQLAGFLLANLFGTWIVMLGVQFYRDAIPLLTQDDAFINQNFLVVSKRVTTATTLTASSNTFSTSEVEDLRKQPFCKRAAGFTSSRYKVSASMSLQGGTPLQTELFFESVPDSFVDVQQAEWNYTPGDENVPVILPRSYVALYNFGFAQSRGLPKVSDGLIGMIDMGIFIHSRSGGAQFRGKILGFSNRLNTILVPQDFMDWSNERFEPGRTDEPSRLIVEVVSPADDAIARYMQEKNYDVEDNKLDAGRATYFLRVVVSLVLLVGLLVCALSFYILMLSVYLLVQKNTHKLETLLLLGYTPARVARPYQLLTIGLNIAVLVLAFILTLLCRNYYTDMLTLIFPQMETASPIAALGAGCAVFAAASAVNCTAIRRKVIAIWHRKA